MKDLTPEEERKVQVECDRLAYVSGVYSGRDVRAFLDDIVRRTEQGHIATLPAGTVLELLQVGGAPPDP